MHARACIRRGEILFIERTGAAGHVFTLLNEDKEIMKNGRIYMDGQEFTSEENGDIYIPFSTKPGNQKIILSCDDYPNFCSLSEFKHKGESYSFYSGFHIDR